MNNSSDYTFNPSLSIEEFIAQKPDFKQWKNHFQNLKAHFASGNSLNSFSFVVQKSFIDILDYTREPFKDKHLAFFLSLIKDNQLWDYQSLNYFIDNFNENNLLWCETLLNHMDDSRHHQDNFFDKIYALFNHTDCADLILHLLNIANDDPQLVKMHMVQYDVVENNLFNKMVFIEQHKGKLDWDSYDLMRIALNHDRSEFVHYLLTKIDCEHLSAHTQEQFVAAVFSHDNTEMRDFLLNTIKVNLSEHGNIWQAYYIGLMGGGKKQLEWLFEQGYSFYPEEPGDLSNPKVNKVWDDVMTSRKTLWEDLDDTNQYHKLIHLVQCIYHYQPEHLDKLKTELKHSVFKQAEKIMNNTLLNLRMYETLPSDSDLEKKSVHVIRQHKI
jgi:hypothetical protein